MILGWILTALLLALLYFYGYDRRQANSYAPANAGVWAICKTSLAFLAASLGETARWTFPFSGLVLLALLVLSAGIFIFAAWRGKGLNRGRALGILCFMGASSMLALGVGWGRAGFGYKYGFFFPLFSVPILCCIYFACELNMSRRIGHFAQACLLICLCFAIWGNIPPGLARAREKHALREAFKRDLQQKISPYMLIARHRCTSGYLRA